MLETAETKAETTKEEEPQRFLIPSPLGSLGIEIVGPRINRVIIVPKGGQRRRFTPLSDLKRSQRSEFVDEVLGRFSEYLAGARRKLDLEYDLKALGLSGFSRRVLKQTARIRYGKTKTYQQIAQAAGRPGAYRQVLAVLMDNPLPLVIPCHRVTTSKSGIGSYLAGTRKKTWLLKLERKNVSAI